MWLTFPRGQNSDLRAALYVDFPSRLDFIICSNSSFAPGGNQRELTCWLRGAVGQRPSVEMNPTFVSQRQPDALIPCEFENQESHCSQGLVLASPVDQRKSTC